ncbi:cyanophycin synthetase [Duganella sp. BJB488]|uniref:cyanophycin synthetase n=1 Tax=unclassified Duganella TaxID=2636909 RepID=UPI000E355398|nr:MULTISPECIES: cyanophycin synthetase [unclassified Duganella]NVD71188.1 cyanophycin synthetase [Duganella sp. BJB1802]RFP09053.1 cyanophycin synthetase [Duganella sp. BJB489]RFP11843.1 cyanophycin synthetase [Duganella sp. BJB488]RFP29028.1 cyanophycin synthetase [Duganella sp. BJB480]
MTKKKDIEVLRVTHLRGPNIWTYRPVIEAWLDIGELENFPSNLLPGLYERLTAILPGLIIHRCGVGEHGGFLERLRDGTYAGHILEHVVLELQNLAGMKTGFGKTRQIGENTGLYKMAFRTRQEQVGRAALAAGRDLLMAMIEDKPYDLAATVAELTDLVESLCLGPSTANIVDAATVRKIPSIRLTDGNLVQLGHGARQRRIWTAETEQTSAIAEGIASDKDLTKSLLASCGVPVPEGELVTSAEAAWEAAQDIGLPVVVKPYDGNHGRGVSLNLMTEADVTAAYVLAARKGDSKSVIVERFIAGNEHRLLVVGKRLVAAAAGEALWVTGDGKSNIIELCDAQINTDPRRGTTEDAPLNAIAPQHGAEIILELQRQGMTAYSIPLDGQKVLIQPNGNVATDVTDQVHPQVAAMATLAARVVGLDIAGIDVVAADISRPLEEQGGAIIEVNASPGLLAHIKPAAGEPRNVGEAIVDHLFAPDEGGRMPIVGITGKHGATMASRLIAWLLQISGKKVGLSCADGLFVNGRLLPRDGFSDWESGERLLLNKNVEAGVFEASARMILTEGLAYDKCAVGVVTDVSDFEDVAEFHIASLDKLYGVLRTQVDVILPSGVAVLNAADPQVVDMADLCDGDVMFYGVDEHLAAIAAHRQDGKRVVFQRAERIVLAQGHEDIASLPLSPLVPPEAVLAAIAAGWALGLTPELIGAGLRTFEANPKRTHH